MALHGNATSLLTLPLELRELIYKEVLLASTRRFDLLQTCKEINTEAQKFLYQRPLVFHSQDCLYDWLTLTSSEHCSQVTDISVFIRDVNLRPLLQKDLGLDMTASSSRLLTFEVYEAELAKIRGSFEKIPKVSNLTLRVLPDRQSFLYREFLARVLKLLSNVYPMLVEFETEGNMVHQNLEYLAGFRHLRHFAFDGVSASSLVATVDILNSLEHLQSLSLTSHQALATSLNSHPSQSSCFTKSSSDNLTWATNLHGLFSPTEALEDDSSELLLAADILTALRGHKTLREISIYYAQEPTPGLLIALGRIVKSQAEIKILKLDWPNLPSEVLVLYDLIDDIETFQIKPKAPSDAINVMCHVWTRRSEGDLGKLRSLILARPSEHWAESQTPASNRKDRKDGGIGIPRGLTKHSECSSRSAPETTHTHTIAYWKKQLEALDIQVLWYTEHYVG
ncbi:hypothetical protein LEMA_P061050.1 [Plenodomus lingam JN3]|uniref:Uncharacterized protein n=1 Tax=Leptosphaeria maculans (strain JN3 / isolate v23.1.3 / race Av1-4-5-6-7-8) TaxID=985895 RepID=E4ZIQ0_LEPMJ|nr:hypothetical protein LEMA_P061050.1 [Plenodomus lingam JN3]CBX91071.1 hypothetical protein LEMA_P061050.1 [Plenodomus lingam JN3]